MILNIDRKVKIKEVNSLNIDKKVKITNCALEIDKKVKVKEYSVLNIDKKVLCREFTKATLVNILQPISDSHTDTTLFKEIVWDVVHPDKEAYGGYSHIYDSDYSPDLSVRYGVQIYLVDTLGGSKELTEYCTSFSFSRNKSDLTTWNMVLQDTEDMLFSPENTGSEFYGKLYPDFYQTTYTLKKYILVRVRHADTVWQSNQLIITDYDWDSSNRIASVAGTDKLRHLYVENQNMDPFENTTAKAIIIAILKKYNINKYKLNFYDYDVSNFAFAQCTPIDRIKDLLYAGMAHFYYKDDTFYGVTDDDKPLGNDWIYKDRLNIYDVGYGQSLNNYYNEITVGRTTIVDNIVDLDGKGFGHHSHSLSFPLINPHFETIFAKNGSLQFVTFFDDSGNYDAYWDPSGTMDYPYPMTTGDSSLHGAATSVTFSYMPSVGNLVANHFNTNGVVQEYKARVTGINPDSYVNSGADESYNYHYTSTSEQKKYGVYKYPNVLTNELLSNSEHAERFAKWVIRQYSRNREKLKLKSPLNMFVYPGDTLVVTDYGSSFNKVRFYVDSVNINISNGEISNEYMCSKYNTNKLTLSGYK